ncbi:MULTISPECIES: GntR family transcriptional regulator [Mammaliicoccus]|uniref:GntR family transcriptional regulator n=1 Tax=Mammaliicoccus vitulinus TaxID=71237 RepID=A0ABX7HJ31_9STAP|nr:MULTISPECIES: GntR family transcriptional regulator [Mammaliicoccus]HAL09775.1 GntR family transcriptional regulator [Staphylococcus sp.]MBO3077784.1 GntR family transcriptional regulator [Mammaliicoccus vitulinus]PNZ38540.1 GntR family transcriptional regulator [Mammaliicoccus vitulinus]PTI38466.1 GntR family transcriptional regulator [Mammaliicoccus vitulinus]PTI70576.1 GntR family transcriptional regulator [Mammaliicoccus vitulinus]
MLKYELIAERIEALIENGQYEAGDKLPSVEILRAEFNVSKSTIINALKNLEKEGLIYQARGSGIYVRNPKRDGFLNLFTADGFSDDLKGHEVTSKVLKVTEMKPEEYIKNQLKLKDNESVYYVERIRYVDSKVFCIETSYFSKNVVLYMNEEIANGSIFDYIENNLKVKVGFTDIYFKIEKLSQENAQHLELKEGDPSLEYEQIFYTSTGIPFDYSKIIFHYENSQFYIPSIK